MLNRDQQLANEYPILLNFEESWVAHDYLRVYLKNSAQNAKKDQQNKDKELATAAKGKGRGECAVKCLAFIILMASSIRRLTFSAYFALFYLKVM
jgi:hypothetical protein